MANAARMWVHRNQRALHARRLAQTIFAAVALLLNIDDSSPR